MTFARARFYSRSIGRFTTFDPSGQDGGINTYAYALNNPINLLDVTGKSPTRIPTTPKGTFNPADPNKLTLEPQELIIYQDFNNALNKESDKGIDLGGGSGSGSGGGNNQPPPNPENNFQQQELSYLGDQAFRELAK